MFSVEHDPGVGSSSSDRLADAQRALEGRPRLSARAAISVSFAIAFLLVFALTVAGMLVLFNLRGHIGHLEDTATFESEILEARRYEKNYLFFDVAGGSSHEDLDSALDHLRRARSVAEDRAGRTDGASVPGGWALALEHVVSYQKLLEGLTGKVPAPAAVKTVREAGRTVLQDAVLLSRAGRREVGRTFDRTLLFSVVFLVLSLAIMGTLAAALIVRILRPIRRFVDYTHRIAAGDFSPILPVRRFRDEFSHLAVAFNVMLAEIRERQEQLTQAGKLAALGTLTSGIAHELNNPLNNISLTAGALRDALDEGEVKEMGPLVDDIFTQVDRASGTVRNLLDFTRREEPALVLTSVSRLVKGAVRLVRNEATLNHVEISIQVPEDLPPVRVSVRDMEQVFLNLFLNAIQAMPKGGTLGITAGQGEEGTVVVRVSDSGTGIEPEHLIKLFDPFFTTKDVGEGTGLGLTVSHRLVTEQGGRIEVVSEPSGGAIFSVILPVKGAKGGAVPPGPLAGKRSFGTTET